MPKQLKTTPTKTTLLYLKKQLVFLEQGHELLERKKELLTRLVYERLSIYRTLRREAKPKIDTAYYWLGVSHMRLGGTSLRRVGTGLEAALRVEILPRSSVGVQYPSVKAERLPLKPLGLWGTDASFDEARLRLAEMAVLLARLGEAETALRRLLDEQRKTQKRVNALKYNIIPQYRESIRHIEAALEEEERTRLFQIQLLRNQKHI